MPSTERPGGGRRWRWRRADLLTFLVATVLCSASYCLAIWHNSRGAADSRVLGLDAAAVFGSTDCRGDAVAGAAVTGDDPLDFEAHHTAEGAGLSVSVFAAATRTARARRALRGAGRGAGPVVGGELGPWSGGQRRR